MDKNIINQILEKAEDKNFKSDYAPIALKWYRRYISSRYKKVSRNVIRHSPNVRQVVRPVRGGMYTFKYVPKGKDSLPYYDSWPLIIPFRRMSGGRIHAFNLHYLPPKLRMKILWKLSPLLMEKELIDEQSAEEGQSADYYDLNALNIRYDFTGRGGLKMLRKCTRTYILNNIRGKLIEFPTQTWPVVAFLPIARWRKEKDPKHIWKDMGF